jgi:hypothetical protein
MGMDLGFSRVSIAAHARFGINTCGAIWPFFEQSFAKKRGKPALA